MDYSYQHRAPSQTHGLYTSGFVETPYPDNRPPTQWAPSQPDHATPRWTTTSPAYAGPNVPGPTTGAGGFGGHTLALPYGFDPSIPPPTFGCPPPRHFLNTFGGPPQPLSDSGHHRQQEYDDFREAGVFGDRLLPPPPPPRCQDHDPRPGASPARPEDEAAFRRQQDAQWLRLFLQRRVKVSKGPQSPQHQRPRRVGLPGLREALYGAAQLVSALEQSCRTLTDNVENDCLWTRDYLTVLSIKSELQDKVQRLRDGHGLKTLREQVSRVGRRRSRRRRTGDLLRQEETHRREVASEKEAAIDAWRMKQIRDVEERKKEQELKLAADLVLSEVRKKQADLKRMQDVLRSLEKLRGLRKEAAARKGINTERECDEAFSDGLARLRGVMKRRTGVYSAEENALMVMLEGEQEEERRREQERRAKKEKDAQSKRKLRVDAMLFGDDGPVHSVLQPFREHYTQAQRSLHTLIQVRRGWDMFTVAADHPDGSRVPQSWILPEPPSDQDWASALHSVDAETH
ncbi:programmed cell death protein 7 [Scophthalmus maximus]|uniref:programmed cell death protein 7 n=1 Tax=Scophthalmus maximus TaxID=52904 RepID=UPI001FA820F8|nr:programmed cell death protein 7 [Scophthalmus maximus]